MGFSTLLDILGSTVIGGMLLMILLRINDAAVENTYTHGAELMVQENLVAVVELLEHDFRKIGFCRKWNVLPDPAHSIIAADSNDISFLTDFNSDGAVDTIRYYTGPTSELAGTVNPRDRMLYRIENNAQPMGSNLGVTQFRITYYDALGNLLNFPITVPSAIYIMQIDVTVENFESYNQNYSTAFWRQIRLAARNLSNR
ncbi:MAG: hypothetical protein V1773_13600 [bacterium]